MTVATSKTLQALVQDFFLQHLVVERNASTNTIASYRDAMKLFLQHAASRLKCTPDRLDCTALDVDVLRSFLGWLRHDRGCGARTCNQRLAVLKSFARYVAVVAPEYIDTCRRIRELSPSAVDRPEIQYLTQDEVVTLIGAVDNTTSAGRRDQAILLLLYNTGARVQEVIDLDVRDIHGEGIAFVRLQGKGRKQRTCPLWARTLNAVRRTLADRRFRSDDEPLLLNNRGQRLSRSGVAYLLRRAQAASGLSPNHAKRLTPHVMRHTTAMHLLQSGADITTIAAWLGHSQLDTTHGYVEVSLRMKQQVLAAAALPDLIGGEYPAPDIVDWLQGLARAPSYVQLHGSFASPNTRLAPNST